MTWQAIRTFGCSYAEVYQDENLIASGWVIKFKGQTEYRCFFDNGGQHPGISATRGRWQAARQWVEEQCTARHK